jgi:dihydroorotate dehydrogenase
VYKNFLYKSFLKPLFFQFSPEDAHELAVQLIHLSNRVPMFSSLLENITTYQSDRLRIQVKGIDFPNPVGLAAGFDKKATLYPVFSRMGFGSIEIGTITKFPQEGNPKPRVFRIEENSALINRFGFNNPGFEVAQTRISVMKKSIPLGINVGKSKITENKDAHEDYTTTLQALFPLADYAVINISSPNTPGLRDLQNVAELEKLLSILFKNFNQTWPKPIFVKFSPDMEEFDFFKSIDICMKFDISGLILTNTTLDKSTIQESLREQGGLSGKPLRDKSTVWIKKAYKHLNGQVPIIGVGGIDSGEAALEKIMAGASLLQIYTGYVYEGPFLPYTINQYLDNFMIKNGINTVSDLIGKI